MSNQMHATHDKTLTVGGASIEVKCEWLNNDGEKWSFETVFIHNDAVAEFRGSAMSGKDVVNTLAYLNERLESLGDTVITDYTLQERDEIMQFVNDTSRNTAPRSSPSAAYFGM